MRIRVVASCAAITCAGAALASAASCVSTSNPNAPPGTDASFPAEDSSQPGTDSAQPPGSDAGPDTSPSIDATPPTDSAATDSATAPDSADANPGCAPTSITGFVVPPYIRAAGGGGAILDCNNGESVALGADCFSDASTPATCAGFPDSGRDGGAVSALCLGCLFSPEGSDAGYGPIIGTPVPTVNVGGCVQLNDLSDAGYACAQAIQAAWECTEFACKASCPVTDTASGAAYVACTNLAATGVCSAFTTAAQSCIAVEQADAGSPTQVQLHCFDGTTPLLEYFCGS